MTKRSFSKWLPWQQGQSQKGHSQRRQLWLLLAIAGSTLTVSSCAFFSYSVVRSLILDNLKENALLRVQQQVSEVDRWLGNRKAEIDTLANDPTVRSADWGQVNPRLQLEMERLHQTILFMGLSLPDGISYTTQGARVNVTDRLHFQRAMTGKLNISDPVISRVTKFPVIIVAAPIRSLSLTPKKIVGVLTSVIEVKRLAEAVGKLQYGSGSYAFALNSEGIPIIHPNPNFRGTLENPVPSFINSPDPATAQVARQMIARREGIDLVKLSGKSVYVAYLPLTEADWSMALVIPRENIEVQLGALNLLAGVISGLLGLALIGALWLVFDRERNRVHAKREALLNRLTQRIRASLNLKEIVQTTVEEVVNLLHLERAAFGWYEPGTHILELLWEYSPQKPKQLGRFLASSELKEQLQQHQGLTLPHDPQSPSTDAPLNLEADGYLALSVPTRKELCGYLICSRVNRRWSQDDIELLQRVVEQLAIAINQSDLYSQTQEQVQLLDNTLTELKRTQTHLVQSEKMSSLGQMVAGIAHEINNPVNFIFGNLPHTSQYVEELLQLVALYQEALPNPPEDISEFETDIDLEFIQQDLPQMLSSMKMGAERIRDLVLSLRNFSRLDEVDKKPVDIHEGIDNTLLLLSNRLKNCIQVVKHYGNLPTVECYPSQLNQVFMNLLSNAIDALLDSKPSQPIVTITTTVVELDTGKVMRIAIADNGSGIPPHIQTQVFNPFFTTKAIGKGTGLGLAISYQIVVEGHGGNISLTTPPTGGTEFIVEIPLNNHPISVERVPKTPLSHSKFKKGESQTLSILPAER